MTKCAIVTGAASGIGEAIAKGLSENNYNVVVADINKNAGNEVASEIGGRFIDADLTDTESCKALVDSTVQIYGSVDILINNAGFQHISPIESFPEETWDKMIKVMLTAPFLLTKYAWPSMKKKGWGRVVNIASIHGMVASLNKAGYITAKHGLIGLTKTAALEGGGDGITVNALCPAYVRTPLVEDQISAQAETHNFFQNLCFRNVMLKSAAIKRIIEPKEIADLVLFLCSDRGASVTGASWAIDCGWTAQ